MKKFSKEKSTPQDEDFYKKFNAHVLRDPFSIEDRLEHFRFVKTSDRLIGKIPASILLCKF